MVSRVSMSGLTNGRTVPSADRHVNAIFVKRTSPFRRPAVRGQPNDVLQLTEVHVSDFSPGEPRCNSASSGLEGRPPPLNSGIRPQSGFLERSAPGGVAQLYASAHRTAGNQ